MEDRLFPTTGDLRDIYQSVNWAGTPLGPPDQWSPALVRSLRLVLDTGFPSSLSSARAHRLPRGTSPPLVMGQIRCLLRGIATTLQRHPDEVLTQLDSTITSLGIDRLTTLVYAELEPASTATTRRLRWANAGHPPPIHLTATGDIHILYRRPNLLLGVGADASRDCHDVLLGSGDAFVLYTDGLIERRGQSLDAVLSGLADMLSGQGGRAAAEVADYLIDRVGGTLEDDVAMLILRVQ